MSSFGEVCNWLSRTFLTRLVVNHWATGRLRVNSAPDYNISFVSARGEYNTANHTSGRLCYMAHLKKNYIYIIYISVSFTNAKISETKNLDMFL